jgi:AcrR family transcriptional regulator
MAPRAPRTQTPAPARKAGATRPRIRSGAERYGGSSALPSELVAEIQRTRLLAAAVRSVEELGYTQVSVSDITQRSRVSRRTFYELFRNREECLAAVLESAVERIRAQLAQAQLDTLRGAGTPRGAPHGGGGQAGSLPWRERVRGGLWAILCFLDREPALARFCVVQSARGAQPMLERREQLLRELASVVDEGREEGARKGDCPPLTAEGLVGAAFSILYARLLRGEREPLTGLQGELMGMIVLPYLGPAAARRERARPAPALPAGETAQSNGEVAPHGGGHPEGHKQADAYGDPLQGIHMHLTYRTARVLEAVAELPGASNRIVGDHAGIPDQGQISKLLARLKRLGLLENGGEGVHSRGEAYAWQLTPTGRSVVQAIAVSTRRQRQAA